MHDISLMKLPPQDTELEDSILSAILINNSIADVMDVLIPDDFYKTANKKIFQAACDLKNKQKPVDLMTVVNKIKEYNQLEDIGGATYIADLTKYAPLSTSIPEHCKIIKDHATRRNLIATFNELTNKCYDIGFSVNDLLEDSQKKVFNIDGGSEETGHMLGGVIDQVIEHLEELSEKKCDITGISSGYERLDLLTCGFQPGDWHILAGRPAMGKSALIGNILEYVVSGGDAAAIFSVEMSKEVWVKRMIASSSRVNSELFKNARFESYHWEQITNACSKMTDDKLIIDDVNTTYQSIIRACRKYKKDHDIKIAAIDYLQLVTGDKSLRREEEVAAMSRGFKLLAKELNIPIIGLAQLNRMLEQRANKRPMLSDLRESGSLEQDPDVIMFIYRDEIYNKDENNKNKAELIIAKNRHGATGTAHLAFLKPYTRFESLAYE